MKTISKAMLSSLLVLGLLPAANASAEPPSTSLTASAAVTAVGADALPQKIYELELSRWGIYNNNTHPAETTDGLNKALKWASEQGYTVFKVPAGTYLIRKEDGKTFDDPKARINMVSNMTFLMDDKAVLQKETNGYPSYTLFKIGPGVKNVTLKGGTYRGDKDTHNYSIKGTHEGGYGIITSGAEKVTIDGIKAVNFTGDGLSVGSMGSLIDEYYAGEFKSGSVDAKGKLIPDSSKTRLEKISLTHPYFQIQRTFQLMHQQNLAQEAVNYIAYFYKSDGTFLSSLDTKAVNRPMGWGVNDIPAGAAYMNVVFPIAKVDPKVYLEFWMQGVSRNVVVRNSEFAYNRRQGITVGGAQNVKIENNRIHDMKGTAPQSGIDLEAGYLLNDGVHIKGNDFYNNQAYDVVLYDGRNAIVEGNHLGSRSIGLATTEHFKYATIVNNHFDGSNIVTYNNAAFLNNRMNDGMASFLGKDLVLDGMQFTDTLVNLTSTVPFGIQVTNIAVTNTKKKNTPLTININPLKLTNVTIKGQAAFDSLSGNAADGSVFDRLSITDFTRTQLPRGTYNDCIFDAALGQVGAAVNNTGSYEFNRCTFTAAKNPLEINSYHGMPDSVSVKGSTINVTGDNSMALSLQAGRKILIENNRVNAGNYPYETLAAVQVNGYWDRTKPNKIGQLTIKGNTIQTKGKAVGISTIYAGTGAPAFTLENNTLIGSIGKFKGNDRITGTVLK
ncbi:right-handed parallel beta-helix repeat-containing protein [Paenibacillus aurantius]|uniref:Right-handed parallel beta-helix repeat-containing protein n=1 Tax=Paenibacillus aurantius TaxID=2918900 RepID=A0AA96LGP5_9BACL|nr:right-handed parallel beta-helix repeat-containing protein [Paenibacillus aurantius]WNQ12693.1 right-handed parallel beta-helix repeat-containing protein [Paenibacillus aurantius]